MSAGQEPQALVGRRAPFDAAVGVDPICLPGGAHRLDGATEGGEHRFLLQIFSGTVLGPVFFEFIQRAGDEGFGEGNFKALFESLERDQIRRGVLKP